MSGIRRVATNKYLLRLLIAAGLLFILVHYVDLSELGRLGRPRPLWVAAVLGSTATMVFLSSRKWESIAADLLGRGQYPRGYFAYYVALGMALGQVVSPDVAVVATRSSALRVSHGIPLAQGALTAVIDRLLDYVVLGVLVIPSVAMLSGAISIRAGLGLSALILLGLIIGWTYRGAFLLKRLVTSYQLLLGLLQRVPLFGNRFRQIPPLQREISVESARQLMWLSLLRFGVITFRSYCVALALGLNISWALLVLCFPIAQLLALPITPGSLGTFELGWYAILRIAEVSGEDAAAFVVGYRLYAALSVIAAALIAWAAYMLARGTTVGSGNQRNANDRDHIAPKRGV